MRIKIKVKSKPLIVEHIEETSRFRPKIEVPFFQKKNLYKCENKPCILGSHSLANL